MRYVQDGPFNRFDHISRASTHTPQNNELGANPRQTRKEKYRLTRRVDLHRSDRRNQSRYVPYIGRAPTGKAYNRLRRMAKMQGQSRLGRYECHYCTLRQLFACLKPDCLLCNSVQGYVAGLTPSFWCVPAGLLCKFAKQRL